MQKLTLTGLNPENSDLLSSEYFQNFNFPKMAFPCVANVINVSINEPHTTFGDTTTYIVDVDGELVNLGYFTYDPKELIDFVPLCKRLDTLLGVEGAYILWDGKRPMIHTPQFDCGVFFEAVRKCDVQFFNFSFDAEKKTLWGNIHLNYESYSGGCNGMLIMSVWYNYNTAGWTMETEKERVAKYQRE